MIVASILFILGAAGLLGLGLWQSATGLLSASIATSLLAAVLLVVGARRAGPARPDAAPHGADRPEPAPERPPGGAGEAVTMTIPTQGPPREPARGHDAAHQHPGRPDGSGARAAGPHQAGPPEVGQREAGPPEVGQREAGPPEAGPREAGPREAGEPEAGQPEVAYFDDDVDPPDEPAPQQVSAADAARVGRMTTEVLVVDGRPRYHLPGCVHLLARECEPLPVGEAVELGFTPCSLCEPDSALLADARRV